MLLSWPDAMRILLPAPPLLDTGMLDPGTKAFVPKHFDDFVAFHTFNDGFSRRFANGKIVERWGHVLLLPRGSEIRFLDRVSSLRAYFKGE
jgi:hypothetical protein